MQPMLLRSDVGKCMLPPPIGEKEPLAEGLVCHEHRILVMSKEANDRDEQTPSGGVVTYRSVE